MNRTYNLKLDLQFRCNNSNMEFWQFDENTSDFYIRITNNGQLFDIEKAIVILAVIKPNGSVDSQFIEVKNGLLYADLKPSMKDEVGNYQTRALLIFEDEKLTTDIMTYTVNADNILSALNVAAATTQEFTLLTDMLSRLSTIELNEVNRQDNFKLLQQEWDKLKVEFDNYVYVKVDERVDEVIVPIVDTKVENLTNQVVIDLTDRIAKADNKMLVVDDKIAEVNNTISNKVIEVDNAITKIPPKEELIGPQGIQGIQGIQGPRGDMGPQGLKGDKGDKGDIGPQGIQGVQGYKGDKGDIGPQGIQGPTGSASVSINDNVTNTETTWSSSKIGSYVNTIYTPVEGTYISVDSIDGWVENVQILGNTYQGTDLSIIKSVGDKMPDGRFKIPLLCTGKNIFDGKLEDGHIDQITGIPTSKNGIQTRSVNFTKVNPNQSISTDNDKKVSVRIYEYDKNKAYIKNQGILSSGSNFVTGATTQYIKFVLATTVTDLTIKQQLEYGTIATPIEPYQSNKLTILSDYQIEKVGTVADKIVQLADGKWYIEKNIGTYIFNDSDTWSRLTSLDTTNTYRYSFTKSDAKLSNVVVCDVLQSVLSGGADDKTCIYVHDTVNRFDIRQLKTDVRWSDATTLKTFLNGKIVKYATTTPVYYPLADDQQIALRTFNNKTNISFLTEIEGTIKCDVPKSTSASVNAITSQVSEITKDLERVKKLEDATTSTVIDDKGFVNISDTANGYLSDIKIEGRTLNNLVESYNYHTDQYSHTCAFKQGLIKFNNVYTAIVSNPSTTEDLQLYWNESVFNGFKTLTIPKGSTGVFKHITLQTFPITEYTLFKNDKTHTQAIPYKVVLLEGDYTQAPPQYFEGMKSVGQDATKIVVSSIKGDGNLLNVATSGSITQNGVTLTSSNGVLTLNGTATTTTRFNILDVLKYGVDITAIKNFGYSIRRDSISYTFGTTTISGSKTGTGNFALLKNDLNTYTQPLLGITATQILTEDIKGVYVYIALGDTYTNYTFTAQLNKGTTPILYRQMETDKKEILYLDTVDSTWKKPVFRGIWSNGIMTVGDIAEKKSDGKYSYRKRMSEVVLNGSEAWSTQDKGNVLQGLLVYPNLASNVMSDKFKFSPLNDIEECIWIYDKDRIVLNINKSKLTTQDVAGFKAWLQANPVTVVYELKNEQVYECTPLDLSSYDSETNYIFESGVLSPRSTIKVQNFLGSIINNLKEQVSVLQNKVYTDNMLMKAMLLNHETRLVLGGH